MSQREILQIAPAWSATFASSARLLIKADQLGRLQNMPLHRLLQLLFGWCPLEGKPGIQCVQFEKIPVRARGGHGPP